MGNTTKTNVTFTFMMSIYFITIYIIRLTLASILGYNVLMILPEAVFLITAILVTVWLKPNTTKDIGIDLLSFWNTLKIIAITLFCVPAVNFISSLSTFFVENKIQGAVEKLDTNPLWLNIIIVGLIPAICEEIIFRGILFHGYKKRNPLKAMILSSLLFGVVHLNINQFLYAFVMGMIFCLMVYATGSIVSSIIAHFVFNTYSLVLSEVARKALEGVDITNVTYTSTDYLIAYGRLAVMAVICLVVAYFIFKSLCNANRGFESIKMIFGKENRKKYDDSQGRFIDGYLIVGLVMSLIYMMRYGV